MTTTTGVPKPAALPYADVNDGDSIGISLGYADIETPTETFNVTLPPIPAAGGGYMNTGAVFSFRNPSNGGIVSLTVAGGGTIDGSPTYFVPELTSVTFITTATEYTLWKMCANGEPPG